MSHDTNALGDAVHAVQTAGGRSSSAYSKTLERNKAAALMAPLLFLSATINAEVANVITVDLQLKDLAGQDVEAVVTCEAELLDGNAELANGAAFHLGESGDGNEVTATDRPRLIFTTSATGVAQLEVTDVGGASGATRRLRLKPLGAGVYVGSETLETITFD